MPSITQPLDQLNASTRRYIAENPALVDNVFQADPLLAHLKNAVNQDFPGGSFIQESFIYQGLIGGSYRKGKEFNIAELQAEQSLWFDLKFFEVNVTLTKEDIQVLNKGPQAAYSLVDARMSNAYMTIGAHIAIQLYLNGTRAGFEGFLNGLAEALNDGSANSWDANTYASYGGITRSTVDPALDSVPTNVAGAIEYNQLEETYSDATVGNAEPNLGVTTARGYSFVKEKFQTQQRFNDTQDPAIGFNGLKFNSATLIKSRYAPGSYVSASDLSGNGDAVVGRCIIESSNGVLTAYPTVANETLWWLNARKPYMCFYISNDAEYGFGFTGFKPAQGNTIVAGQVLAAVAMTVRGPRYHRQLFGISG